ncbi:MAG TPA: alkaline phosphatase PhoX [Myxococcaceae bacterium]|nr:alkaline phosphatase PhoX [Myxococcaceae bacterium]
MERRTLLQWSAWMAAGGILPLAAGCRTVRAEPDARFGPLLPADANGLRLPEGFTSRVIATTGERVKGTDYTWHPAPDGGAVFATDDGGWIYVSNSEVRNGRGGVGMVRFSSAGEITDARRILDGTHFNCAGGPTPWGTWLSCEEIHKGRVWECDPTGTRPAVARSAMGVFCHEAAAAVPQVETVFLTEDLPDGGFYRFRPERWGDLSEGVLEILVETADGVAWKEIPDVLAKDSPTRHQVPGAKRFDGGEGIWFQRDEVFFSTKGDGRIWAYHPTRETLRIHYDPRTSKTPVIHHVDNLVGDGLNILVAEDGPEMRIVALRPDGTAFPVLQLTGVIGSEIAGPAFSPDGTRLYFSSQRRPGRTYEVRGPWRERRGVEV